MGYLKGDKGIVLVLMLFTVAIVSLIGVTLISASLRENTISSYQENSVTAQYLAEYGLQKAMVSLKDHPNWKFDPYWEKLLNTEIPLHEGTYILAINEKGSDILEVVSTGRTRNAECILNADVKITQVNKAFFNLVSLNSETSIAMSGNVDIYGDIYSNADLTFNGNTHVRGNVTCLGTTTISGNINIDGELYSGGDIVISGDSSISGNVLGRGNITISGRPYIKGTIQINGKANVSSGNYDIVYGGVGQREPIEFPKLNSSLVEEYRLDAMDEGRYYEQGTFPMRISGTTFVDSDVSISGNTEITGQGVVFVNGDLEIRGNTKIKSAKDGAVVFIVNGDVTISGNQSLECVFFASGVFRVNGNPKIFGCIVSRNIIGAGNLDIMPLENLQDRLPHNAPGAFETDVEMKALTYGI